MRTNFIVFISSCLFFLLPVCAQAEPEIGKKAPEFTAIAVDGATVTPSAYSGDIVVVEWNNPLCPFVRKHYDSGSMQKLQAYARNQKVIWLTVNSGAPGKQGNMDVQQAKDYIAHNNLAVSHYILDPDGAIGKLYEAKSTPHMFVIDKNGNIAYMGAIDNHPDTDQASLDGADNYVRDAIDSLVAGHAPTVVSTQAYGCSVKYAN